MNHNYTMKRLALTWSLLCFVLLLQAQAPKGYYSSAKGQSGKALKTALFNKIANHTQPYGMLTKQLMCVLMDLFGTCILTLLATNQVALHKELTIKKRGIAIIASTLSPRVGLMTDIPCTLICSTSTPPMGT